MSHSWWPTLPCKNLSIAVSAHEPQPDVPSLWGLQQLRGFSHSQCQNWEVCFLWMALQGARLAAATVSTHGFAFWCRWFIGTIVAGLPLCCSLCMWTVALPGTWPKTCFSKPCNLPVPLQLPPLLLLVRRVPSNLQSADSFSTSSLHT